MTLGVYIKDIVDFFVTEQKYGGTSVEDPFYSVEKKKCSPSREGNSV